jgi:hypothetical protein
VSLDLDAIEARAKGTGIMRTHAWSVGDSIDPARLEADVFEIEDEIGVIAWADSESAARHIAGMDPATTLALVAELHAAREVIAAVLDDDTNEVSMRTDIALDAYEKRVGR